MTWLQVEYETLPWASSTQELSRRAARNSPRTYESALVSLIAQAGLELPSDTLALVERATIAATRFDATEAHRVIPFTPLLLRSESVASSRIEHLTSSARKILEAEVTGRGSANATLIAANTRQMAAAIEHSGATVEGIRGMHRILLAESAPDIAGVFREQPVWIGGSDFHPGGALFVPPHHRHIEGLLGDLEEFMNRRDVPILAQAAIAHAQFESIHPFADGNGRTGRALVHVMLRERGLTTAAALPISAGLLVDLDAYFGALDAYRNGDAEPIVDLFAKAALDSVARGQWLAAELDSVRAEWDQMLSARSDALAWQVLRVLVQMPMLTTSAVSAEFDVSAETARNALERLETGGIVVSAQLDKRQRAWRSPEVLALLDEFAVSGGRRG